MSGEVDNLRDALVQIVLRLREDVLKDSVGRQNSGKDGKLTVATTEPVYSSSFPMPALLPYSQQITPLRHEQRGEAERGLNVFPRSSLYHGYSPRQVRCFASTSIFFVSLLIFIMRRAYKFVR